MKKLKVKMGQNRDAFDSARHNSHIVNADDFGISQTVNKAICEGILNGYISSTTLLANGDAFENAITLAKKFKFTHLIGLHFNIVEGLPLTEPIKNCTLFCDEKGLLSYKRNTARFLSKEEKRALLIELQAQIDKINNVGINLTHFDSHEHSHTEWPIFSAIYPLLLKNGIKTVRLTTNCLPVSIIKKVYKTWYNHKLRRLGFITTDCFCAYSDLDRIKIKESERLIEVMIHPDIVDGELSDSVTKRKIEYKALDILTYKSIIDD